MSRSIRAAITAGLDDLDSPVGLTWDWLERPDARGGTRRARRRARPSIEATMTDCARCLAHAGCPASLIVGTTSRRLPDPEAEAHRLIRILDEDAGEPGGYLYPAAWFEPIEPGPSDEQA